MATQTQTHIHTHSYTNTHTHAHTRGYADKKTHKLACTHTHTHAKHKKKQTHTQLFSTLLHCPVVERVLHHFKGHSFQTPIQQPAGTIDNPGKEKDLSVQGMGLLTHNQPKKGVEQWESQHNHSDGQWGDIPLNISAITA